MLILPALVGLLLVNPGHSLLRFSATVELAQGRDNPLGDVAKTAEKDKDLSAMGKELADAAKNAEKAAGRAADAVQKGPGPESVKRKPMDPIEAMRAMMCWGRSNLLEHEKCMDWMTVNCRKETTGEGYCKKLRRYVRSKCKRGSQMACDYGKKLGMDMAPKAPKDNAQVDNKDEDDLDPDDLDGDGVKDKDDAFPDNPLEWKDSDGDGVGDNSDRWPNDPTCADEGDICGGPAPAPAASPWSHQAPAPSDGLTMDESIPLPSQGYNEFGGKYVAHDDGVTMTSDWRAEWPRSKQEASVKSICAKNPGHPWCKLMQSESARKAYAISHP